MFLPATLIPCRLGAGVVNARACDLETLSFPSGRLTSSSKSSTGKYNSTGSVASTQAASLCSVEYSSSGHFLRIEDKHQAFHVPKPHRPSMIGSWLLILQTF